MKIETATKPTSVTQLALLPAIPNPQQEVSPTSSSSQHEEIDTSVIEDVIDYFRIWFVLDAVTIHRREIPGKETYSGFFSQMKSLFGKPDSIFDISRFEYVLVAKQGYREVKAEQFTGPISYLQMRDELLKTESPWRHSSVRQIMTGLAALESYAKLRPPPPIYYWPYGTPFPLQNSQIPPSQPTAFDRQGQAENAPPIKSTLPIRSTTHPGPILKQKPLASKWIRPKKPVSDPDQEPLVGMRTKSRVKVPADETNGRILSSSNTVPSSPLSRPPLSESICLKRRRVTEYGTSKDDKRPAPSPVAALNPRPIQDFPEVPSTAKEPMELIDQTNTQGTSNGQSEQTPRKRKFLKLIVSRKDGDEDKAHALNGLDDDDEWDEVVVRKKKLKS